MKPFVDESKKGVKKGALSSSSSSSSGAPSSSSSIQNTANNNNNIRRGKWTSEEENYANRLIHEFKRGLLPLTDGTTLRTFLSKLLNCEPMRISKKFVGNNCIGKQVFRRRIFDLDDMPPELIESSRKELADLERRFLERVAIGSRARVGSGGGGGGGGNSSSSSSSSGGGGGGAGGAGVGSLLMARVRGDGDGDGGLLAPWMVASGANDGGANGAVHAPHGRGHGAAPNGVGKGRGRGRGRGKSSAPSAAPHPQAPYATMPQLSLDTVSQIAARCDISALQLQAALEYYHETYNQPQQQQPQSADECEAAIQHIQVLQTISNAVAQMETQHSERLGAGVGPEAALLGSYRGSLAR